MFQSLIRLTLFAVAFGAISVPHARAEGGGDPKKPAKSDSRKVQKTTIKTATDKQAIMKATRARGGGGAYNGPSTSGVSIPTHSDREPTLASLDQAIRKCTRAVETSLLTQALHGNLDKEPTPISGPVSTDFSMLRTETETFPSIQVQDSLWMNAAGQKGYAWTKMKINQSAGMNSNKFDFKASQADIEICKSRTPTTERSGSIFEAQVGENCFRTSLPFPMIVFDDTITENSYDEFKNLALETVLLKNLRVINPERGDWNDPTVKPGEIVNGGTHLKTSLKIDFDEFKNCIASGVTGS